MGGGEGENRKEPGSFLVLRFCNYRCSWRDVSCNLGLSNESFLLNMTVCMIGPHNDIMRNMTYLGQYWSMIFARYYGMSNRSCLLTGCYYSAKGVILVYLNTCRCPQPYTSFFSTPETNEKVNTYQNLNISSETINF